MILNNFKHKRSNTSIKDNSIEGIYVPKESRVAKKIAFSGAHFTLGNRN